MFLHQSVIHSVYMGVSSLAEGAVLSRGVPSLTGGAVKGCHERGPREREGSIKGFCERERAAMKWVP